jgi:hypothetical protein
LQSATNRDLDQNIEISHVSTITIKAISVHFLAILHHIKNCNTTAVAVPFKKKRTATATAIAI